MKKSISDELHYGQLVRMPVVPLSNECQEINFIYHDAVQETPTINCWKDSGAFLGNFYKSEKKLLASCS